MSKKITAVIWLINQLEQKGFDLKFNLDILQQAKQLEKEQIVDAYKEAYSNGVVGIPYYAEQYYSETYEI